MNLTPLIGLAAILLAGVDAPLAPETVPLSIVAIEATTEGRQQKWFDPGLEQHRHALADLDFDTYRRLKSLTLNIAYAEECPIPINDTYTLHLTPVSKEPDGAVRLKARIEMAPKDQDHKPINALLTTTMLAPGGTLKIRVPLPHQAELILLLTLNP